MTEHHLLRLLYIAEDPKQVNTALKVIKCRSIDTLTKFAAEREVSAQRVDHSRFLTLRGTLYIPEPVSQFTITSSSRILSKDGYSR